MKYKVVYTRKSLKDLQGLPADMSKRVLKKMRFFIDQKDPMLHAKELKGVLQGLFRFRVGDYRVIFTKDAKGHIIVITVVRIKHRREVYE